MKKTVFGVLLLLVCWAAFASTGWGWQETLTIEEEYQNYIFKGQFRDDMPVPAFAGEVLFSYEVQSPGANKHERFYFSGRTGEDSIEVRHTWATFWRFRAGRPSEETLKVAFKEGGEYPLAMTTLEFPGCTKKETAVLKMLSLKDKILDYRIILPECLKEALKKEKEKGQQP